MGWKFETFLLFLGLLFMFGLVDTLKPPKPKRLTDEERMGMDRPAFLDNEVQQIFEKYVPEFYLHPDEPYPPLPIEKYLETTTRKGNTLVSSLDRHGWHRSNYSYPSLSSVPCYGHISSEIDYDGQPILRLFYFVTFGFNGSKRILWLFDAGEHQFDVEHVQVIVDMNTHKVKRVFYGAHGRTDGMWLDASQIQFTDHHAHTYMALNGHGMYPTTGTWPRLFFIANDHTEKGEKWTPKNIVRVYSKEEPMTTDWLAMKGKFGDGHVSAPDIEKLKQVDKHTTLCTRLFLKC